MKAARGSLLTPDPALAGLTNAWALSGQTRGLHSSDLEVYVVSIDLYSTIVQWTGSFCHPNERRR